MVIIQNFDELFSPSDGLSGEPDLRNNLGGNDQGGGGGGGDVLGAKRFVTVETTQDRNDPNSFLPRMQRAETQTPY